MTFASSLPITESSGGVGAAPKQTLRWVDAEFVKTIDHLFWHDSGFGQPRSRVPNQRRVRRSTVPEFQSRRRIQPPTRRDHRSPRIDCATSNNSTDRPRDSHDRNRVGRLVVGQPHVGIGSQIGSVSSACQWTGSVAVGSVEAEFNADLNRSHGLCRNGRFKENRSSSPKLNHERFRRVSPCRVDSTPRARVSVSSK